MKTLYVSDLDGTLLQPDDRLSAYARRTLTRLTGQGMLLTYATARSYASSSVVTEGFIPSLPVIVNNGAAVCDAGSGKVLRMLFLSGGELARIRAFLERERLWPLIYSVIDGCERVSWMRGSERGNEGMARYFANRPDDGRFRCVDSWDELFAGAVFYCTCIGEREALAPLHARFALDSSLICILQQELYTSEYFCELMPCSATKAHAALRLKEELGCDRLCCFGDGINDLPLFEAADECYAVENAVAALKERATEILAPNTADGVVHWLERRFMEEAHGEKGRGNPKMDFPAVCTRS